MAGPSNETGVVRSILRAVKKHYPKFWHLTVHGSATQRSGTPDLLLCVEGKFFAFEVKHQKPGESREHAYGRTSLIQEIQIDKIRKAGGVAYTVLDSTEVLEILARNVQA